MDEQSQPTTPEQKPSKYWGNLPFYDETIGTLIIQKVRDFRELMDSLGWPQMWSKKHKFYYNMSNREIGIQEFGQQNQLKFMSTNHFRALIKSVLAVQTVNPPTATCLAVNSDSASIRDANLFKPVLDSLVKELAILDKLVRAGESAAVFDAGFMMFEWDANIKDPFTPDADGFWTGSQKATPLTAWQLAYKINAPSWQDSPFVIIEQLLPKAEVAHKYQEHYDKIMDSGTVYNTADVFDSYRFSLDMSQMQLDKVAEDVRIYKCFHRDVPYVPGGRYTVVLEDGTVLFDSKLPYDDIPVERFVLDEHIDWLCGFSPANNIVGPQEGLDLVESAIITNLANFAIQYLFTVIGTEINPELSQEGMLVYTGRSKEDAPIGINMSKMPEGAFEFVQQLMGNMNQLMGVSLPSRGIAVGPEASGKVSQLLINQTTQNQGPTSARYADFQGRCFTQLLRIAKRYGKNKKTLGIIGIRTGGTKTFLSEALTDFDRVICEPGNPLFATPEGKTQFAERMVQYGQMPAGAIMKAALTNNWQSLTENSRDPLINIKNEVELLLRGIPVEPNILDDHDAYLAEMIPAILGNVDLRTAQMRGDQQAMQILKVGQAAILQRMAMKQQLQAGMPAQPGQPQGQPGQSAAPQPNGQSQT